MSTLETTVTLEATLPSSGATKPIRKTGPTSPSPGEIDGQSLPNVAGHLDNFSILRKLGSGAMGVVYAAYDEHLGRRVAIKLLRSQLGTQTSRFIREAQGLARLNHPNVVQVYQVGTHDGRVFIAMEYVAGRTLRTWLDQGPHPREDILRVFLAAGRGLAAAHAANLVHRDFKPDNVMVGDDGQIKVMDFGLVQENGNDLEELMSSHDHGSEDFELATRRLDSALNLELTQPGALIGTPAYMAPEQHLGRPTDARADQFAFCVTLWEALYGKRPFTGDTWQELIDNVTGNMFVEPPRTADVPNWLRAIVERGLRTDPDARWPTIEQLLDAIEADPTRKRRWVVASSVVLAGLLSAGFGYRAHAQHQREAAAALALAQARERDARCTAEGDAIEAAWNDERRAAVESAMLAVDHPTADEAWRRTEALFDDYAATWARTRRQVCVDAELEPQRQEWAALAKVCLDQRRHDFASLTELFTELDEPSEVLRSVLSAASLPAVADCVDERLLDRNVSIPAPEISARVDDVRRQLSAVSANLAMGRYQDARDKAELMVETAEDIDWKPLTALTLYWRGQTLIETHEVAAGERDLEQALFIAGELGDPTAVWAAGHLVFNAAVRGEHETAERWGRVGELLVTQTDTSGGLPHAKLLSDIGTTHATQGDPQRAISWFLRALELYTDRLPSDHPDLATILNNLGVAHQELERNAEALDYHHRALDIRRRALPPNHPDIGVSYFGAGRVYAQQRETQRAIDSFRQAIEIWTTANGPDAPRIAHAQTELGKVYEREQRLDLAQAALSDALRIRESADVPPTQLAETQFVLARVLWASGNHDRAATLARAAAPNDPDPDQVRAWLKARGIPVEPPAEPPPN